MFIASPASAHAEALMVLARISVGWPLWLMARSVGGEDLEEVVAAAVERQISSSVQSATSASAPAC